MTKSENQSDLSRDMLIAVLDHMPTPVYLKDENTNFVASNIAHCKMVGRPVEELRGRNDFDFFPRELATAFNAVDVEVIKTGKAIVLEEVIQDAETGQQKTILTRKARLVGQDGRYYLIGTNSDLTEMRNRENQYRALTETVPVGVAQIDENQTLLHANPLFNAYCGGDGTETDQKRLLDKLILINPGFPGLACKFEAVIQGLGSQPRTVIVISSGWLDLGDVVRSATISIIDISQMSELQRINEEVSRLNTELAASVKKLKDAQDELVQKGRMEQLGQLTATVAHELRNPLGAVRTSAFLLERKLKDKGMGVEAQIERINKGIVRCDNIITQLLDFSRSKQLVCQPGDLDQWLVQLVEEEAKRLPSQVQIELTLGLDGQTVPFDPGRLQRAVINMISNASEAMVGNGDLVAGAGTLSPKISVSTFAKNGHVSLRVADNGPGIPAEVLGRIREPLFTTKSFGTGLGVPAIEQIAVQHGGRLDILSEVGKGSSFTVWMPLENTAAIAEEAA
jgi:PAS domain S-box-containing protein